MKNTDLTNSLLLKANGVNLVITVVGYENPKATDLSDANWLQCLIQLQLIGSNSELAIACTTQDIKYFHDELEELTSTLKGKAAFVTDEGTFSLSFDIGLTGVISVSGSLKRVDSPRFELKFEFESDPSEVEKVLWKMRDIKRKFPIK